MMRNHAWLSVFVVILITLSLGASVWATTLKEEVELGQKLDVEILKQTPLTKDKQALAEIEEYGQNLVKNVNRPEIEYHFRVIKDKDLNAFAVPGGYVYFTEKFWDVLRKDERIGVLGHEIIHVDRRHSLDALSKQQQRQIWLAVLLTAVKANQTWSQLADMLHNVYSLKYSRADEREADELSIQLVHKAGYNPAGLLLAMRKINRFQAESGGQPPRVFSSHPPTPERLQYIEGLLEKMAVAVPPETQGKEDSKFRVGDVTSVTGTRVEFVSTKPLRPGDALWLMKPGWDSYYEKQTAVPAARAVVTLQTAKAYVAEVTLLPKTRQVDIVKGIGVYDPPQPKPEQYFGKLEPGQPGRIAASQVLARLERLLLRVPVWNKDSTQLVYENTGYVVVTDPSNPTGYLLAVRPEFDYSPPSAGANIVRVADSGKQRWVGPVLSIGRRGETIEVLTDRDKASLATDLNAGRRFDIVCPAWDSTETYEDRLVGRAVLKSLDKKIVLQMLLFSPGWDIYGVGVGFDVYESKPRDDSKEK